MKFTSQPTTDSVNIFGAPRVFRNIHHFVCHFTKEYLVQEICIEISGSSPTIMGQEVHSFRSLHTSEYVFKKLFEILKHKLWSFRWRHAFIKSYDFNSVRLFLAITKRILRVLREMEMSVFSIVADQVVNSSLVTKVGGVSEMRWDFLRWCSCPRNSRN